MHCLFVKAPFAGWIVDGVKIIEYRTRETYIRGRIGIIESGTGTVIGDVELWHSFYSGLHKMHMWHLRNPRRYATPVPFEHKRGCVTWAILDIDPDAQKIAPRLPKDEARRQEREYMSTIRAYFAKRGIELPVGRRGRRRAE